ncbi:hypothetical protein JCM3775_002535 [Rhodotorula graminis]
MRDSNFNFPALGRACICVSSGIYDRRALDAPPGSLPLVNSLTHLTYLTATSPRVRDIISHDGGLERLVRVLQHCARGGPAGAVPASLAELKGKGKGKARALPRVVRKSPFRAFADYDLLPTAVEMVGIEDTDVDGSLLAKNAAGTSGPLDDFTYSIPASLLLPASSTAKHLLYTYSLAFQCIVNIGVRGSEAIRTRVVEAGALDVVVFVLERYLEDVQRKRQQNQADWVRGGGGGGAGSSRGERRREAQPWAGDELAPAAAQAGAAPVQRAVAPHDARRLDRLVVPASNSSSPASTAPVSPVPPASPSGAHALPHIAVPPSAISRPLLTRLNVVAASSAAASTPAGVLRPPNRVRTPDTEASSLTGDENGSASGQEQDGDEVMVVATSVATSSSSAAAVAPASVPLAEVVKAVNNAASSPAPTPSSAPARQDAEGDVVMDDGSSTPEQPESRASPQPHRQQQRSRPPFPRAHTMPQPLPRMSTSPVAAAPAPASATPSAPAPTTEDDGALHFRDEDILLSLQLLAYLSKYPHVRSLFHAPSAALVASASTRLGSVTHGPASASCSSSSTAAAAASSARRAPLPPTNIFSLVESFTYRPPADDPFTPRHPTEVQYWAGVIMRNACRKDEAQGGIRQCANMRCGKWEAYAREFAKCRRCRRAKYCSKTCQSEAWNQGHRYWCHKVASRRSGGGGGEPGSAASAHGHGHHHGHGHSHAHDRTAVLAGAAAAANGSGNDSGASGSSAPASPTTGGIATPTGPVHVPSAAGAGAQVVGTPAELFNLVPPVPTPGALRRRPSHTTGSHAHAHPRRHPQQQPRGRGGDEDDEDDELLDDDEVEGQGPGARTTPRASQQGGQALHPHPHRHHAHGAQTPPNGGAQGAEAQQQRAGGAGPFGALDGMGMFVLAGFGGVDAAQGVVAIDEDQVARDMLALGGGEEGGAVRVQA